MQCPLGHTQPVEGKNSFSNSGTREAGRAFTTTDFVAKSRQANIHQALSGLAPAGTVGCVATVGDFAGFEVEAARPPHAAPGGP